MPITVLGGTTSAAGAFEVANSCRFNDGDTAYMHKDFGTPTDGKKWTLSMWVKRGTMGANQYLATCEVDSSHATYIRFHSSDKLQFYDWDSPTEYNCNTNRVFRDPSAWYHLVFVWDSANATAGNRMRIYVNGTEETSLSSDAQPATTRTPIMNTSGETVEIGRSAANSGPFDGYMAEVVFIDGQALTPTSFGEFNEDSPTIWQPIDVSGLTFGTNGFYLDFEASDNLGNDANGGTDLTEVNLAATDSSTDTPTNNFATWNPLDKNSTITLSEGNVTPVDSASDTYASRVKSTIAVSAGKWYAEFKYVQVAGSNTSSVVGIGKQTILNNVNPTTVDNGDVTIRMNRGLFVSATETEDYTPAISNNDIIGIALDMDNGKVYFAINNTWSNSGDPAAATNPATTGLSGDYAFLARPLAENIVCNFGASPTYANSSDAADANGYGKFEFAPPSGYYALCTKNLAEYG